MKQRPTIWLAVVAAAAVALAACDDTAKQQVKAHPPAPAPAPAPAFVRESLPLTPRPALFNSIQRDERPAIDILVADVQANFDAGQRDYQAGNFEKARVDFDRAIDRILQSGFPAGADPRLAALVDKLGEASQNYDLAAEQKTAEEEPEAESTPAPIDELAELTLPPGDPRLSAKAQKELIAVPHDIPLKVNDSVLQYLSFFTTTRGRMIAEHGLDRAGRYSEMIRRVLREEGVPQDLIYLAQAESAFLPQAVSRAGARGIWQFMPFRGQQYDLERTYYVDERSDPEKSTRAAAHHMRDLYQMFGDWYLVMAAYNSGPMNVVKAIERTGYADFWELQRRNALPKQTRNYVPIILALTLVAKDPALYGVQVAPEKPPVVDVVQPGHAIDLRLVSDASGADLDDLHVLNPVLLRSVTPNEPGFALNLPAGAAKQFDENLRQVPVEKWTSWRLHTVEPGETLAAVARRYHVTLAALESANHLPAHATVPAGMWLNVPTAPPAVRLVHYRVQRGDTLAGIAERFDVTVAQLKHWNGIQGHSVPRGSRLKIYAGGGSTASARPKTKSAQDAGASVENVSTGDGTKSNAVQHHVKPGETLYSIARTYRTTVSAIKQSNPFLADRQLEAGDILTIRR